MNQTSGRAAPFGRSRAFALAAVLALYFGLTSAPHAQTTYRYNVPPSVAADQLPALEAERAALFARILANPADLDASFAYAGLSAQLGDLEAAISAIESMRIYAPDVPRLQLDLARLYFQLGAYEVAQVHFEEVAARPDTPPAVRANIGRYLQAMATSVPGPSMSGRISVGTRYTSNANSGPTNRTVTLNGIEATLDDVAMGTPDIGASLAGAILYRHVLNRQGDRIEARITGSLNAYADRDDLSWGSAEITLGPVLSLGRVGLAGGELALSGVAGTSWLGGEAYGTALGLSSALTLPLGAQTLGQIGFDYRHEEHRVSSVRPTADLRDGDRYRLSATLIHALAPDWLVRAGAFTTRRDVVAPFHSYRENGLELGVSHRFAAPLGDWPEPWTLTLQGTLAHRVNDAPDPIISTTDAQDGLELALRAIQVIPLQDDLSLQIEGGYRRVNSNYDTRTFDEASIGISLSYSF